MKKQPRPKPRWLIRTACGCRVAAPGSGEVLTPLSLKHCRFHAAAEEMFWLIAALYFERKTDQQWHDRCDLVLFHDLSGGELQARMKQVLTYIGDVSKLRAHFLDSDAAILAGERHRLDRDSIECRICGAMLVADDDARVTHLRLAHLKEWRALFR